MTPESVDDIPPADESYLSILDLIAYYGARQVEDLKSEPPPCCCGHTFATQGAWLQHQRVMHPGE